MRIKHSVRGFTLIELMIALVVTALLATIALPVYQDTVRRGSRQVASRTLIELGAAQERSFGGPARSYADSFDDLVGIDAKVVYLDRAGRFSETSTSESIYKLELKDVTTAGTRVTAFNLVASAVGSQVKDAKCASLSLSSAGLRSATGSASDPIKECWKG